MPQRITKHGIQHMPRIPQKKRMAPLKPHITASLVLLEFSLVSASMIALFFLATHYPDQFSICCPLAVLMLLIGPPLFFVIRPAR